VKSNVLPFALHAAPRDRRRRTPARAFVTFVMFTVSLGGVAFVLWALCQL